MKHRPKHIIEYALLRTVQGFLGFFPLNAIDAFLRFFFRILFRVTWPKRTRTVARIREVFGDSLSEAEMRLIARESLANMLMNMIELMRLGSIDKAWLEAHIAGVERHTARIKEVIARHGGVILALPHMGNWDLAGFGCIAHGISLTAIARKQNNPLVEAWIVRNRRGFIALDRTSRRTYIQLTRHLQNGGAMAILPDVRNPKPDLMVRFLGKEASIAQGMARFARMAGVPVLPVLARRERGSHHTFAIFDPVMPDPAAEEHADLLRVTQAVMDIFDREIRRTPEQWFWYNKRWVLDPLQTPKRKPTA